MWNMYEKKHKKACGTEKAKVLKADYKKYKKTGKVVCSPAKHY
jgi:hypothetical protein